jgi:hypothetical protein
MSENKYTSEVKFVNHNNLVVYNFLSDFNNLGKFLNENTLERIAEQIPNGKISDFRADRDGCRFTVSTFGEAGFSIIAREEPKTIKITGEGKIPFEIFLWIQILPVSAYQCKIRLTLQANLNMMMKMMVGKKLQEGIDRMADALTMLPYH